MNTSMQTRDKIIEAVSAPLGFFVLALLIVEAFLATILVEARLERVDKITGMWRGRFARGPLDSRGEKGLGCT
jgi:hypothetical protein